MTGRLLLGCSLLEVFEVCRFAEGQNEGQKIIGTVKLSGFVDV